MPRKFSERERLVQPVEIKYRDELPLQLRLPLFKILTDAVGDNFLWDRAQALFDPFGIAPILPPRRASKSKPSQTSKQADIRLFASSCSWFQIYDLAEDIYAGLVFYEEELPHFDEEPRAYPLQVSINQFFMQAGIGWKMEAGTILARGTIGFETVVDNADRTLTKASRTTAATHLREAISDLSRRPNPDLTGALHHALGSMESLARDVSGLPNATLGEILARQPGLVPRPLDIALSKIWGFASNEGRHVTEGREPGRKETELVVGVVAAMIAYLG